MRRFLLALGGALVGAGVALAINWNLLWGLLSVAGLLIFLWPIITVKEGRL